MPIGKKKTALTDANRKKENSFNRCQSEKLNNQKFEFPNDTTDCILRIRSLTFFFRLRPFRIKCEQHYSSVNTFLFHQIFFRNREHFSFTHVIKADWTFVIWTQGSQRSVANQELQQEVIATSSYEKHIKLQKNKQWR